MKVLNFGSLNYDYVYKVDHIMMPGETQSSYSLNLFCGGKGLNQSIALARAGVPVYHAGIIGEDGQKFLDTCKEAGVDTTYIKSIEGRSGHTIIQVDKNAQNCIMLYGGGNRSVTKAYVDEVLENFDEGDIIILQNEISEVDYIVDRAYEKKMIIVLNPSPFDEGIDKIDLSKVSIFLINEIEGGQISGETDPEKILAKIMEKYPEAKVVLTLGSDGAIYKSKDECYKQPIYKVQAVDTTAAGDTFTGYFIASYIAQTPMSEALNLCAKASAITVSRDGATDSIPTMEEVLASNL